jgi:hypothetical protein
MDINLPHIDTTSLITGILGGKTIELIVIQAIKPFPKMIVGRLKNRVKALAAAGKIDAPTLRLLSGYGRATFAWADAEMPDKPGPEKMAAALDKLAAVPYLGWAIRADRAGAEEILQAAYDAIKSEAKEEAGDAPGGQPDAPTITPQAGSPAPTPAPSPAPNEGGAPPAPK